VLVFVFFCAAERFEPLKLKEGMRNSKIVDERKIYYCPVCSGTGAFELPKNVKEEDVAIKKYLVSILVKKGYGVRQIQRALGYRSPQSISLIIKELNIKK